jgi:LPS-assembly protein
LKRALLAATFLSLASLSISFAQEVPVTLSAKEVFGNPQKKVEAKGSVVIKFKDVTIKGQRALLDREKGLIRVWGKVEIEEPPVKLKCQNLIYDLKTKRAVLEKVEGWVSPTDRIKADRVERLNEKTWIAYDGEYTPCKHACPDWSVTAKEFKVLIGESFAGKWVAFRVKEVPILVSPYLSGPIQKKRTSGFLFPRFGYVNGDGFVYKQPFYLVLGRSADLTLTYEKRTINGKGFNAKLRYVLSKGSSGDVEYYFLKKKESRDWKVTYYHGYYPSDYLYGSLKALIVNSRRYYTSSTNFNVTEETQAYTKSDVTASKLWKHAILNVNAVYLRYLSGAADQVWQKLPQVNFYLMDTPIGKTPLTFSFSSQLTYFYRKAGGSGYRLNAVPAVRAVKRFGVVKSSSLLSYNFTSYQHYASRGLWQFQEELRTNRFYSNGKYSLSLNPGLLFFYRESKGENGAPYDLLDRVKGERSLTPSLVYYLYSQRGRLLRGELSTKFDTYSKSWSEVKSDIDLSPVQWLTLRETNFFLPNDGKLKSSNTFVSLNFNRASVWSNYYYQNFPEEIRYLQWGATVPLGRFLSFSFRQRFDLKLSEDREKDYALKVDRGCWQGVLSYKWLKTYDNTIKYQITLRINLPAPSINL